MSKGITFKAEDVEKLYYNEEYDEDKEGRFDGPKGYEGWYISTDTDTGSFDGEKGSMYDYDICLFNDKDEFMGETTGGYYNAIAGEHFNYDLTFYPPAKRTKTDDLNDFLTEMADSNESYKKKVNKIKKHIKTL
jgi:hypothetical protein